MANKLKIYACSGIGDAQQTGYTYWTDNTKTVSNTQAVNLLLAMINEKYAEATYLRNLTDAARADYLNELDWMCVALDAAQLFKDNDKMLHRAGVVIDLMASDGAFEFKSLDNSERDAHLDDLIERARELYKDESIEDVTTEFVQQWDDAIVAGNKVALNKEEQKKITDILSKVKVKGIGDKDYNEIPDLAKYLNDAADYFLYTYFTDDQLSKLPRVFTAKAKQQRKVYDYCLFLYTETCGSKYAMDKIIVSKLIERYGVYPQDVCQDIVEGRRTDSIGQLAVGEIIQIITSIVVPVVLAVIAAIVSCVTAKYEEKYKAIDKMAIDGGIPSESDFDSSAFSGTGLGKKKNYLPWILGGLAAVLLLRN